MHTTCIASSVCDVEIQALGLMAFVFGVALKQLQGDRIRYPAYSETMVHLSGYGVGILESNLVRHMTGHVHFLCNWCNWCMVYPYIKGTHSYTYQHQQRCIHPNTPKYTHTPIVKYHHKTVNNKTENNKKKYLLTRCK